MFFHVKKKKFSLTFSDTLSAFSAMFVPIDINCRECAVTLMGFRDNEAHIQNSRQRGLTVTQRPFSFLAICSFLTVELQNEFPTSHYK